MSEQPLDNDSTEIRFLTGEDIKLENVNSIQPVYANFLRCSHSLSEFLIDFAFIKPGQNGNTITATCISSVLISPTQIKAFISTLQENIDKYEKMTSQILPDTNNLPGFAEKSGDLR